MRRCWSYLLMAAGVGLVLLPKAMEWQADYKESRLLASTERSFAAAEAAAERRVEAEYERLSELLSTGAEADEAEPAGSPEQRSEAGEAAQPVKPISAESAIAVLSIEKLALKLPVLEGATQENMRFAAAHMIETSPLGEPGNAAIAAHRVKTKGRLFNRLNELEGGDKIVVELPDRKVTYTVFRTLRVEPSDISVLKRSEEDRILTLITCDPIVNPTHRLIVQASQD
ncbi:sortase A [Paenibacillus sp. UNCCL117]|uniref:class D sortase n=1 Tax=unclassified Paenibacillus TaxID=185978 RepID=UPI00088069E6|nr:MULTISPECIES: class D sortase [unclassified Paenibacillus]SDD63611.1 sortase A [Paenibacillus sp. cl123]SFW58490.1 sortase A [Paenibacillus sp. UNCCL117]